MSPLFIYLLTVIPNFRVLFVPAAIILMVLGVILMVMSLIYLAEGRGDPEDTDTRIGNVLRPLGIKNLIIGFVMGCTAAAIPTQQQMMLVVTGSYLTNSEWSKLPDDIAVALRKQMADWTKDEEKTK